MGSSLVHITHIQSVAWRFMFLTASSKDLVHHVHRWLCAANVRSCRYDRCPFLM